VNAGRQATLFGDFQASKNRRKFGSQSFSEETLFHPGAIVLEFVMRIYSIVLLFGMVVCTSPAGAAVYDILNQGGGIQLSGFIVTTGKLGVLAQSDILNWQVEVVGISGPGLMTSIDKTNSTVTLTGGALSATSTGLVFNFASHAASELSFRSNQAYVVAFYGLQPAFGLNYCDLGAACSYTVGSASIPYEVERVLTSTHGASIGTRPTGSSAIATLAATPLPASVSLFGSGLAGLAGLAGLRVWPRRQRRAGAAGRT
jgi:hypothetical protein